MNPGMSADSRVEKVRVVMRCSATLDWDMSIGT
jgi:hypothetical protein